jgi:SAM-dependent methyltransferase
MSGLQSAFCRSAPWRLVARRGVLPWALRGYEPRGDVLEIGAGSGAMAVELAATHPDIHLTATDVDDAMVDAASARLEPFGDRVTARRADATALPFEDASFDGVLSWVMLHHTVAWERALAEAIRVLRPGGTLVGYDLLSTAPMRLLHRGDDRLRFIELPELRAGASELPLDDATIDPSLLGMTVRFAFRKSAIA